MDALIINRHHVSQEALYNQLIIDNTYDFMGILDLQGHVLKVNRPALEFAGLSTEKVIGRILWNTPWFTDETRLWLQSAIASATKGNLVRRDLTILGSHSQSVDIDFCLRLLKDSDKQVNFIIAAGCDISERLQIEQTLRESESRHRLVIDTLNEGVVKQRTDGTITMCNPAAERILGLTREQMMGRSSLDPLWLAVHEDGSPFPGETHPTMVALLTGNPQRDVVMGVHKPSGELTWILINAQPVFRLDQTQPYAVVASFTDITALKEAEAKLQHAAVHDALTGLPLRPLLTDRLAHALAHLHRDPTYGIAVLFIDLDGFKAVNDALGHEAGDDLLKMVAHKLTRSVREQDTVARLGGDEFVVLLEGFGGQTGALMLVDRLLEVLTFVVTYHGGSLPISASIGVTFPAGRSSAPDVIRHADVAMYHAKAAGKGRYRVASEKGDDYG